MIEIDAKPYPYPLTKQPPALVIIDMQRDFVEPGGFGSALGNDVSPLTTVIPVIEKLLQVYRLFFKIIVSGPTISPGIRLVARRV